MTYKIGNYREGEIEVTIVAKEEGALTHLYTQTVSRLMFGIRKDPDGSIKQLKTYKPEKVQAVIDALMVDYTPEGIKTFETSLRRGFKALGLWNK